MDYYIYNLYCIYNVTGLAFISVIRVNNLREQRGMCWLPTKVQNIHIYNSVTIL